MVLEIVSNIFNTLLTFFLAALILSVPGIILAVFGKTIYSKISKKFGLSWLKAVFATTLIMTVFFVFLAYFIPIADAFFRVNEGIAPIVFQEEPVDLLLFYIYTILKLIFAALIITILLTPFQIIGSLVHDWARNKRKLPIFISLYLTVFSVCFIGFVVFITMFQWVFLGLLYLIYFA
ncbi:MAG: hypothetical protein V1672_03405 [Candidatus Diapherotrites archaeon]